eukprot:5473380-Amphidinium_carterae.1
MAPQWSFGTARSPGCNLTQRCSTGRASSRLARFVKPQIPPAPRQRQNMKSRSKTRFLDQVSLNNLVISLGKSSLEALAGP